MPTTLTLKNIPDDVYQRLKRSASECSASDCEFVALAARLGVRLVTMDGKLLRAFPQLAANLPTC